ncbi:MAG TPA: hypothetical protein VHZ25_03565 [Acidobacteriaceae bacterium]|nr:hypothetical protein [Acidobacteriaceae bacterium]
MRTRATHRLIVAAAAGLLFAALWMWKGVEACGPWFTPDVFVDGPDNMTRFAAGQLGII